MDHIQKLVRGKYKAGVEDKSRSNDDERKRRSKEIKVPPRRPRRSRRGAPRSRPPRRRRRRRREGQALNLGPVADGGTCLGVTVSSHASHSGPRLEVVILGPASATTQKSISSAFWRARRPHRLAAMQRQAQLTCRRCCLGC